jgi:hypothetical protein
MNADARGGDIARATQNFTDPFTPGTWITGEDMEAMVRMYDLTHDRIYLDHLRDLSRLVLSYRDDRRNDNPRVLDAFTGQVMPAWDQRGVSCGYLHHASLDAAGVYSYPIAAFARIVSENPSLHPDYGSDALVFANATLETLVAFSNELRNGPDDSKYFANPAQYRTLLTEVQCQRAYDEALAGEGPDGWIVREGPIQRLNDLKRYCNQARELSGYPLPHNKAHALEMAMIEAWRAVDSAFHRQHVNNLNADWARVVLPIEIKRTYRWFERHLRRREDWFEWHYADGVPDDLIRTEDTSHGDLSMRYVGVLHRSAARLNATLVAAGHEPIELSNTRHRLANTFLSRIGTGHDLAHKVDGSVGDRARDYYNGTCAGWLDLAGVDSRIYNTCRDIVLRVVAGESGPQQKYLNIVNHASLLFNKPRGGPPTTVPDVIHKAWQSAATEIRSAGLEARFTGEVRTGAWVAAQRPRAGAVVDSGNTVVCTVRTGAIPGPNQTIVPNLKDLTKEEATDALQRADLVARFIGRGTWIFGQSPAAEEVVNRGTRVECRLRAGRPPEEREAS